MSIASVLAAHKKYPPFYVVMGNEAADLDSVASAIAWAYAQPEAKHALPLINIPVKELKLRQDVVLLLQEMGINPTDMLFRDDLEALLKNPVEFCLVDHNQLPFDQKELAPFVAEILDHHVDANAAFPRLKRKIILTAGSNATLVAERILSEHPATMNAELSRLLLIPILIDTAYLTDTVKTTAKDRAVVETLLQDCDAKEIDTAYKLYAVKKLAIDPENFASHLIKDFKTYTDGGVHYGISSLPASIYWNVENQAKWQVIANDFLKERQLDCLLILSHGLKNKVLIVLSAVVDLQKDPFLSAQLQELKAFPEAGVALYLLKDPLARKNLQPHLRFKRRNPV